MRTASIVRSLIQLTQGASCGDLASLEAMMVLLVKGGHIPPAVVRMLWDTFTLKVPGSTLEDSRAAVLILSMVASADQGIVKSNINALVSHGLDGTREDAGVYVGGWVGRWHVYESEQEVWRESLHRKLWGE